ncbi:hypothetical protein ACHAW6_013278 [Cyclotella cf. meneghiniana]
MEEKFIGRSAHNEDNPSSRTTKLVHKLLSITPANDDDESSLKNKLHTQGNNKSYARNYQTFLWSNRDASAEESFICSSISKYNNMNCMPCIHCHDVNIWETLGELLL